MRYEPSPELLASLGFEVLVWRRDTMVWWGRPVLLYLGCGRLMNHTTAVTVTLAATTDAEFRAELPAHGWRPA